MNERKRKISRKRKVKLKVFNIYESLTHRFSLSLAIRINDNIEKDTTYLQLATMLIFLSTKNSFLSLSFDIPTLDFLQL